MIMIMIIIRSKKYPKLLDLGARYISRYKNFLKV